VLRELVVYITAHLDICVFNAFVLAYWDLFVVAFEATALNFKERELKVVI